jgi:hypothetical protein
MVSSGSEDGGGVRPRSVGQLPHLFAAVCERFYCYVMLHIVGDHTDLQRFIVDLCQGPRLSVSHVRLAPVRPVIKTVDYVA